MPDCNACAYLAGSTCTALPKEWPVIPVNLVRACVIAICQEYSRLIATGMRVLEIGCGTWSPIRQHCRQFGSGLGVEQRKLQTIYYGIDAARFGQSPRASAACLRKQWGIAAEELAIGFVGRLVPQKDIGTLIRGFALFAATFAEAKLVIVGSGPLNEELRRSAEELGISGRIVWAGFRDDIVTVMSAFDIFALTSIYEGFGLVLLEAMSSRLPVVATRAGAVAEVVADGETGILVGPRRPEEVAAAFHKLRDGRLRTRFGEAGRARVLREFTLGKMWQQTDALYARCVRAGVVKTKEQIGCAVSTVN